MRERLRDAPNEDFEAFAHEVRRYYPFVPMLAARTRRRVSYAGRTLPRGRRVILDVYGTLHDPAVWPDPHRFDAERFAGIDPDPWIYVPQGGGPPEGRVAVELIKTAARHLVIDRPPVRTRETIPLDRMPSRPLPTARA